MGVSKKLVLLLITAISSAALFAQPERRDRIAYEFAPGQKHRILQYRANLRSGPSRESD